MIGVIVACDDGDSALGDYFSECASDIESTLNDAQYNSCGAFVHAMRSDSCNYACLCDAVGSMNGKPFVFVAYTHGTDDGLVVNDNYFLSDNNHNFMFRGSFIFSASCLVARKLGPSLVDNECAAFIGYKDEVNILIGAYRNFSVECCNVGLKLFFTENYTIQNMYQIMLRLITQKYEQLLRDNQLILASQLVNNREALILLGNGDLSVRDLMRVAS
jgi:hypothetical protein